MLFVVISNWTNSFGQITMHSIHVLHNRIELWLEHRKYFFTENLLRKISTGYMLPEFICLVHTCHILRFELLWLLGFQLSNWKFNFQMTGTRINFENMNQAVLQQILAHPEYSIGHLTRIPWCHAVHDNFISLHILPARPNRPATRP
jgi:hypothetical protein